MARKNQFCLYALPLFLLLLSCGDDGGRVIDTGSTAPEKTPYDYFVELSKIPRCSAFEGPATDYLLAFADAHGLEASRDGLNNVLIRKGGSSGREGEPPIALQAHIDMVCKSAKSGGGYDRDIFPVVHDINYDWVTSLGNRSTLGADNGSGVSMIMAILASKRLSHPPVEALFLAQEEEGLLGAFYFDVSVLASKRIINIDMVTEGVIVTSSTPGEGVPDVVIPMEPHVLAKRAGCAFPDWPHREESSLRERMVEAFWDIYGKAPIIGRINNCVAGIDLLAFAYRLPDVDMAAIGPDIENLHTVNERMRLSSYNRVYDYLVKVLEKV